MPNHLFYLVLVAFNANLSAQSIDIDTINFLDTLQFTQTIIYNSNNQIDYIQYDEIDGQLKKIEFYDSEKRIDKDEIWKDTVIRETVYEYLENNQVIKRYNVTNQKPLPTQLNVHIKYPALARENEIEGIVEVKLIYNSHCIPQSYEILNSLGNGIDEEVNKKMKLIMELAQKYNAPFDNCYKSNDNFKINFKLD